MALSQKKNRGAMNDRRLERYCYGEHSVEECACGYLVVSEGLGCRIGPFSSMCVALPGNTAV
jgi:hypothetical protein